ncbi:unnamed protein product [Euphydryas editha]|uniref:Protein kinase domain-containing protein n=1 Tax=Euphydryas editha TaxID=104508 RepID=A0AAU9V1N7_EUPED|nr:unnamed protein product [Euphydryas editha]
MQVQVFTDTPGELQYKDLSCFCQRGFYACMNPKTYQPVPVSVVDTIREDNCSDKLNEKEELGVAKSEVNEEQEINLMFYKTVDGSGEIPLLVKDIETPVAVWGEGGGTLAAAALLLAIVRHVLGYSAHLQLATADFCDLAAYTSDWSKYAVVAPALSSSARCDLQTHPVHLVTNDAPAAFPSAIYIFAHLFREDCEKFVKSSSFYTTEVLKNCGFIESKDISTSKRCDKCFAVLARNESKHDTIIANELQLRIRILSLPLELVFFQSELLLRKMSLRLQNENRSFLFLDVDIWTGISNIFLLHPPTPVEPFGRFSRDLDISTAVRVGNGDYMKIFSPPISTLVNHFTPASEDLRQILEYEISLSNCTNIEEAACYWALNNERKILNWTLKEYVGQQRPLRYIFKIFLCNEDPDYKEYKNILYFIKKRLLSDIKEIISNISIRRINCTDTENFKKEIEALARNRTVAGAVAWGSSVTVEAINEAKYGELPLLLAGPTSPEVLLDSAQCHVPPVHAVSATLINITSAYLELFHRCEWTRIAILSDDTSYSKTFIKTLLTFKKLLTRERIVNTTNIHDVLEEYRKEDARIFFVNTKWNIARIILRTASKLGMTPNTGIMWIVRDWRTSKNYTEEIEWGNMYHFTISSTWREGPTAGGSVELQAEIRKPWPLHDSDLIGSADSASLADAILLLGMGFAQFLRDYPSHMYDPHAPGSGVKFMKSLSKLILNGTAQELKSKPYERLVFIEKWYGTRGSSVALWYVNRNGIRDFWPNETATCRRLLGHQLPDRQYCAVFTTGDPFAPRCHVPVTMSIVIAVLSFAFLALFLARRARLAALSRPVNEENQRVVSWPDRYLVSRDSITIFHKIGEGANGEVHFAELKTSGETVLVAAKEPRQWATPVKIIDFLHEGGIMAPLHHENVIRLVGVCIEGRRPILLMEHAYYNDLQQYLSSRRKFAISDKLGEVTVKEAMEVSDGELTRFAREAARALEYLAENKVVHRDVRAANCLVDKNRSLKLADFGLARKFDEEASMYMSQRRDLFPVLYMAPESLEHGAFSTASDVWALGVLILEVATLGARPYGVWLKNRVIEYVIGGGHPPLPPDTSRYTRMLTTTCWQFDAKSRPTAKFIHDFLTRNPQAISPALLTPDFPDYHVYPQKRNKETNKRNTSCDLISLQF